VNLRGPGIKPRDVKDELPAERNLRVNTFSLIVSNVLTGVFGFLFWVAAARLFPAQEVGVAAALIASAMMLSTLSILSIDTIYERFLPVAGTRAGALLKHGFFVVTVVAMLSGAALVAFGPRHPLFESGWAMAGYPVLVMVLAVFTLQDKATVGLGVARWSAAKNSIHAVAKLIVLLVLAGTGVAAPIVLAWGVTAAASALCILVAMHHRSRSNPRFRETPNLPSRHQVWSYFGSSFGITAVWAIGPLVVPLIVVTRVGAVANAHFAVAWAMISALYVTVHLVISPYVAEVAAHPGKVASLSWRMVRTVTTVTCLGSVGLAVLGPIMLSVVGAEYRVQAQGLLYLGAIFVPLSAVTAVYEGVARVQRRLRLVLAVRCVATLVVVCGSLIGTRSLGVAGVGWAYLAAESLSATVLLAPVVFWLQRATHERERDDIDASASAGDRVE
jgi:O-antigen/teichoic acid export membrane protein